MAIHLQGGSRIGMGHVFRMVWLARCLRASGAEVEMLLRGDRDAEAAIRRAGFAGPFASAQAPAVELVERYLAGAQPVVWVNDCLKVDRAVHAAVQRRSIPIISFDDVGDGLSRQDVIVNAMPSFWRDALSPQARLCQGPAYMVLDPLVARVHDQPKPVSPVLRRIAVTFGGSDPHGMIFKALEAICRTARPVEWHLFIGPLFGQQRRLAQWRQRLAGQAPIHWHQGKWDVIPHFSEADLALCSSGHTLFEMLGVGTPVLAVANAPHEMANGKYFASHGACRFLGLHAQVTARMIERAVAQLLDDPQQRALLSQRSKALVDGLGIERVTRMVLEVARAPAGGQS